MVSNNKTVMRAISILIDKREKLRDKKQALRNKIDDKYPPEVYGIKGEMKFSEESEKLNSEINLLSKYISGLYDLIEMIEYPDPVFGIVYHSKEEKRAEWLPIEKGESGYSSSDFRCSKCGKPNRCNSLTDYCCNCGVKMIKRNGGNNNGL